MIEIYEIDKLSGDDLARKTYYSQYIYFNPQIINRIYCLSLLDIHGKIFAFKKMYNLLDGRILSDLLHHNFTWRRLRNVYRRPYRRTGGDSK